MTPSSSPHRPSGAAATTPGRPRDNLLKRSVTARLLMPPLGALALLWLLAALTWYAAHQGHAVNAAAAATQDRVVLLSEIRSLSRSLQRDALNLITEDDASERTTILHKFTARSHAMRADLRAGERVAREALHALRPRARGAPARGTPGAGR